LADTVTAQKREENVQDVPIAISAFGREALPERARDGGMERRLRYSGIRFQFPGSDRPAEVVQTIPVHLLCPEGDPSAPLSASH
jgi:hypothetical protein